MKHLIIRSPDFDWDTLSPIVQGLLQRGGIDADLTDDLSVLESTALASYDALVMGGGFNIRTKKPGGGTDYKPLLSNQQAKSLFEFVRAGKGLLAVHGMAWGLQGEYVTLIGGQVNLHPERSDVPFKVQVLDQNHPVTAGISDFFIRDELFLTAWDPTISILAGAEVDRPEFKGRRHALIWAHNYGRGRVFYSALGHWPSSYQTEPMATIITRAAKWVGEAGQ